MILATDFTLVSVSTVGAEALFLERPCISLQPGLAKEDEFILSASGNVPVGYTIDDCLAELGQMLSDEEYRCFLSQMAVGFSTDGKATQRVTNLVYEMLNA